MSEQSRALDRLEIKKDASILGHLTTAKIMIEGGAYLKGAVEIEHGEAKVAVYPDLDLAQSERDIKLSHSIGLLRLGGSRVLP